jgi:hypothetical protein
MHSVTFGFLDASQRGGALEWITFSQGISVRMLSWAHCEGGGIEGRCVGD